MNLWAKLALTSIATLCCVACEAEESECSYLSDGYLPFEGFIFNLAPYPLENVTASTIADVRRCWAKVPYGDDRQYDLELVEARRASPTQYYLIFKPRGIEDVGLAFLVEEHGGVLAAYQATLQ